MSVANTSGAVVEDAPHQMAQPTGWNSDNEYALFIRWIEPAAPFDGGSKVESYNLQYQLNNINIGIGNQFIDLISSKSVFTDRNFYHTNLQPNTKVTYRIRAKNRWGWGPFSNNLQLKTIDIPAQALNYPPLVSISQSGDV